MKWNNIFYPTAIFLLILVYAEVHAHMKARRPELPKTVGTWQRPDRPRLVDASNIFKYMNGAGELYLGYRFKNLEVYEYRADCRENIIAEIYFMETPEDAFGWRWRLPPAGGLFRSPPRRTRTRTVVKPGFALYPRLRALRSRSGFFTRTIAGCFRHAIFRWAWTASKSALSEVATSREYLYNDLRLVYSSSTWHLTLLISFMFSSR